MRVALRPFCVIALLLVTNRLVVAEGDIDEAAVAILREVEAQRMEVKQGRMEIELGYRRDGRTASTQFEVVFAGENRIFRTIAPAERPVASAYDGVQVVAYDSGGATISNLSDDSVDYLFDPRTIGITGSYRREDTIRDCLGYVDAKKVAIVDRDDKAEPPVQHVQVIDKFGQTRDFWIEDAMKSSRVVRYAFTSERGRKMSSVSTYAGESVLPESVETEFFEAMAPVPNGGRTFKLLKFEKDTDVDASDFGLAGLNMAVGTPVVDLRISRRIGYWNGKAVQPELP
jgi:hypothetical protein